MGRLSYIDEARGVAVLLMIQVHALQCWLSPEGKTGELWSWGRWLGGFAAPLFLFLAGLSLALAAAKDEERGRPVVREGLRRGLEVVGWAYLFRLWMFVATGLQKPLDLLRVDVLNCMGVALVACALLCLPFRGTARVAAGVALAAACAMAAPFTWHGFFWGEAHPALRGWWDGSVPRALFPLFPWAGFVGAGVAAGTLLALRAHAPAAIAALTSLGVLMFVGGPVAENLLPTLGPRPDYWNTSPAWFVARLALLPIVLAACWIFRREGRSLLARLGQASLLVYWVHVEIVYGAIVARPLRGALDERMGLLAVTILYAAMAALAWVRTEWPRLRTRPAAPPAV